MFFCVARIEVEGLGFVRDKMKGMARVLNITEMTNKERLSKA